MEIKLKDELIKQLLDIVDSINGITVKLGQVELDYIEINKEKVDLTSQYNALKIKQRSLFEIITKEHGEGILDLNKGVLKTDDQKTE